jgi:hypothetical protein
MQTAQRTLPVLVAGGGIGGLGGEMVCAASATR